MPMGFSLPNAFYLIQAFKDSATTFKEQFDLPLLAQMTLFSSHLASGSRQTREKLKASSFSPVNATGLRDFRSTSSHHRIAPGGFEPPSTGFPKTELLAFFKSSLIRRFRACYAGPLCVRNRTLHYGAAKLFAGG